MGLLEDITGIKNNSSRKGDFQEKVKKLKLYYTDLVNCLNETADNTTPGIITFAEPESDQINNLAGKIPSLEYFEDGFEKIYPEQIRSAWLVMVSLIGGETQEHVTGLTQLGKNGLITMLLDFLGIVSCAHNKSKNGQVGKLLLPIAWLPNAINMEKQSIEKFRQSMLLNGIIKCHIGVEVHMVSDLHKAITKGIKEQIKKTIEEGEESNTNKTKFKALIAEFFSEDSSALVLRRSMAKDKFYSWLFKGAQKSNSKIVLVMDESHIAIGGGQAADRILKTDVLAVKQKKKDEIQEDEIQDSVEADVNAEKFDVEQEKTEATEILNSYNQIFKDEAKLVTISATNLPFSVLKYAEGKKPIYLEVTSGYCGFPFIDGMDYPLGKAKIQSPIVKPIKEIAKEFKLPDLEFLNLRTLDHALGFGLYMMNKDWQKICEKLNDSISILCSNKLKIQGDFTLDGRGKNRAAKILKNVKNSKARELVQLFEDILNECETSKFLDTKEFIQLFTKENGKKREEYLEDLVGKEDSKLKIGWKNAIKAGQKSLGDLLKYLLIKPNPQAKKGCILRWECKNESYDNFIKELSDTRFKNSICFIPYMEESAKSTVAEILKTSNPNGLPYLISVTGRGRYGESYPRDCGYAIDCTTKNSTAASFFQSLLGRLTGYGKYDPKNIKETLPLLILSDLAYEKVFLELLKGKGYSDKVGTGKDLVKTGLNFKPIELVCVSRGKEELNKLFDSLDEVLAKFPKVSFNALHSKIETNFFDVIAPYCALIEKSPLKFTGEFSEIQSFHDSKNPTTIEILKPGQEVDDENKRQLDWEGRKEKDTICPEGSRTYVAFEDAAGSRKFGLKSSRNRKGKEFLHIGFRVNKGRQVQSLYLWLKKPIISAVTGPTDGAVSPHPTGVPGQLQAKKSSDRA